MARGNYRWLRVLGFIAVALSAVTIYGGAQQQGGTATRKPQQARSALRVRVTSQLPVILSLRAVDAPMTEIAAELGRQLNVPVALSPLMQKQRVTLEFNRYPLEAALNMLAPQAYVDYVVGGQHQSPPKCTGIHMLAYNEAPPPLHAGGKGSSVALIVAGDTDEIADESEAKAQKGEPPLVVTYEKKQLTVRAQKQPLLVVLYEIAIRVGVPLVVEDYSREVVDTSFYNYPLDQAIRSLSPAARLYFRTDSQTLEMTPLRIVLAAPDKN
ncbi:MAG TPA: hypothetical protein VF735_15710 [Pyrinomonadaceae bacterium]|jgi:hypothetical protein